MPRRLHAAGATIFEEGGAGDSLHIVVEGEVRISVLLTETNGVWALGVVSPARERGGSLGDLALVEGRPRSASGIALVAAKTRIVTRDDFRRWLSERPSAARAWWRR